MGPLQVALTAKAGKMTDLVSQVKKKTTRKMPHRFGKWVELGEGSGPAVCLGVLWVAPSHISQHQALRLFPVSPPPLPVSAPLRSHSPLVVFVMCARTGEGEGASDPQPNQLGRG